MHRAIIPLLLACLVMACESTPVVSPVPIEAQPMPTGYSSPSAILAEFYATATAEALPTPTATTRPTLTSTPTPAATPTLIPTATSTLPPPTPTTAATPTPIPERVIYAPREVWECYLARDASRVDENGIELSPCGWRSAFTYKAASPIAVEIPTLTDRYRRMLRVVLFEELEPLLRLSFVTPEETHLTLITIDLVDAKRIPCEGHDRVFPACADVDTNKVTIATRYSDAVVMGFLRHELLHILVDTVHAEQGIMRTAVYEDESHDLTEMDKAQLWLHSNPLIKDGFPLTLIKQLVRYGEWEVPPPI